MDLSNNNDIYTIYTAQRPGTHLHTQTHVLKDAVADTITDALMISELNFGNFDDVMMCSDDYIQYMYWYFMDNIDHPQVAQNAMDAVLAFVGKMAFKVVRDAPKKVIHSAEEQKNYIRDRVMQGLYEQIRENEGSDEMDLNIGRNHLVNFFGEEDAERFIASVCIHLLNGTVQVDTIHNFFTISPH